MSKKIKHPPLWMAAKNNTKLPQEIYKQAYKLWTKKRGNKEIIHYEGELVNTTLIKKAYHSEMTRPEVRLMFLQKVLDPSFIFLFRFKQIDNASYGDFTHIGLRISRRKGQPYLSLKGLNPFTGNFQNLTLTKSVAGEVRATTPAKVSAFRFLEALGAGNTKGMKAVLSLQNINEYILALVDMIHWTNKKHNIWNSLFWNSERQEYIIPTEEEREEFIKGQRTGRFINDLTYMKNQFENISPVLQSLGVDTKKFLTTMQDVIDASVYFENVEKNIFDFTDLFEAHKEWFRKVNALSSLAVDEAGQINALSIDDLVSRMKGFKVPKFVHFNPNRSGFIKTNNLYKELRELDEITKETAEYAVRTDWKLKRGDWPYY